MPHLAVPAGSALPVPDAGQTPSVDDLRAATDAELLATFATPSSRTAAMNALVSGLVGQWAGPTGTVRLVVGLPQGADSWDVRFAASGVVLSGDGEPDAEVRLPLVSLVRLVTGQADGALLHLSGTLGVSGDQEFVLGLGESLTVPGRRAPLVEAAALDPVAVSAAISEVPLDHLAAVMAGGFRALVLREVFSRLPEFLIAEKAVGARVVICFAVGGRPDGGTDRYVVRVADGTCTVTADTPVDEPVDATLHLDGHEFLRLVLGHLNPVRGVLSGQLRVEGQVIKALGFNSIMRIPSA